MAKKFSVFAQVRNARQGATDIHNQLLETKGWSAAETIEWARIEEALDNIVTKLEMMDLKEDVPHE